jgi:hypothetical protein
MNVLFDGRWPAHRGRCSLLTEGMRGGPPRGGNVEAAESRDVVRRQAALARQAKRPTVLCVEISERPQLFPPAVALHPPVSEPARALRTPWENILKWPPPAKSKPPSYDKKSPKIILHTRKELARETLT